MGAQAHLPKPMPPPPSPCRQSGLQWLSEQAHPSNLELQEEVKRLKLENSELKKDAERLETELEEVRRKWVTWQDLPPTLAAEMIVDVRELRYSQLTIQGRWFKEEDGQPRRSLEELIDALKAGSINPMQADFLKLTVVLKMDSQGQKALFSTDNRRLYCLKEYQREIGNKPVPVRVRIFTWADVQDGRRILRNCDETDGHSIQKRDGSNRSRSTSPWPSPRPRSPWRAQ
ncbi:unnamed protein product [Durusdinium trenchii]|uniref:Uncharacterized protein n=5 Tax=Durusdinium trenchii TaxID=1381693 RepID=A0ABP0J1C7_9DINO